ncbi:MAG: hypothetical protein L0Z53_07195 [Acidobacteriales bacterium]|nr:hypothetical protein [Terriglobales bacterium]
MTTYKEWEAGATNKSVEGKLAEARQRRQDAVAAEQARLEAENRHKQEIAALDAEIKALERQQAAQRWEAGKAQSNAILARNEADAGAFRQAVDEVINFAQQKLIPLAKGVDGSFLDQLTVRTQAVGEWQRIVLEDIYAGNSPDAVKVMAAELQPSVDAAARDARSAYPAWIWLNKWAGDAPPKSDMEKWRTGLFLALFGVFPADVTGEFDWQKDINQALNESGKSPRRLAKSTEAPLDRTIIR